MFNEKKMILKCLPVRSEKSRLNAIKEWFLLKLNSVAKTGPKIESYFGFDILMFSECTEFAMEVC